MYRKPTMMIKKYFPTIQLAVTLTRYCTGLGPGLTVSVFVVSSVLVSMDVAVVFNRFNGDNNSSILSLIVLEWKK